MYVMYVRMQGKLFVSRLSVSKLLRFLRVPPGSAIKAMASHESDDDDIEETYLAAKVQNTYKAKANY